MQCVVWIVCRVAILASLLIVIPAPIHASQPSPATPCSTPLTVTLQPGLNEPNNHVSMPAAPNIPPAPVAIHVPLYPGATPSTLPMPQAEYTVPASKYLKGAWAEYLLPTDWDTASGWYRQAFSACGYTSAGQGYSGNRSGIVSIGIAFSDPKHPPLQVSLAFEHAPSGGTLALYVATTNTYPPPAILVPGMPNAVTILKYHSFLQGRSGAISPEAKVVVRDVRTITELAHHLDNLPPVDIIVSCPLDDGSHDDLRFSYPDGHTLTVEVGLRGCRIIRAGNQTARGTDEGLFSLLATLLARPSGTVPPFSLVSPGQWPARRQHLLSDPPPNVYPLLPPRGGIGFLWAFAIPEGTESATLTVDESQATGRRTVE